MENQLTDFKKAGVGKLGFWACAVAGTLMALSVSARATTLVVAYAGSMGPLMDRYIGPRFAKAHDVHYHGIGRGAFGLARMIKARQLRADVFLSITRGPVRLLEKAHLANHVAAFASTRMVLAWSPHSPWAKRFLAVKAGNQAWYKLLETRGIHFGRTDPLTDPQGRATVLCLMLAAQHYHQPLLASRIVGHTENPSQIFSEASLMFRLRSGQIDASIAYQSAARAAAIPYLNLPPQINLGDARFARQYADVTMRITSGNGHVLHFKAHPLIFYSAVLKHSHHPRLAAAFLRYLRSRAVKPWMLACGYTPIAVKIGSQGVQRNDASRH